MWKAFFVLLVICIVSAVFSPVCALAAEAPNVTHQNYFGNPSEIWACLSGQQTKDGGYIISGWKSVVGDYHFKTNKLILIKTDTALHQVWIKEYVGNICSSVMQTSDGGYFAAGAKYADTGKKEQAYIIKTAADGTEQWNKTFGGSRAAWATFAQQTKDGCYIVTGQINSTGNLTAFIIKTDVNGKESWNQSYDSKNFADPYFIQQTSDGGYITSGSIKSDDGKHNYGWLLKTDGNGTVVWERKYGDGLDQSIICAQQTSDGGYIAVGWQKSKEDNNTYGWLFKVDREGNPGGFEHDYGYLNDSVNQFGFGQQVSDGGYVAVGRTQLADNTSRAYIVKTASTGQELWNRTFYFKEHTNATANSVRQTSDGGYFIVGRSSAEFPYEEGGVIWAVQLKPDVQSLLDETLNALVNTMSNTMNQVMVGVITGITVAALTRLLFQRR